MSWFLYVRVVLMLQVPYSWVLQQGEAQCGGLQPGVHSYLATLPAQRLWSLLDLFQLRALQEREQGWHS